MGLFFLVQVAGGGWQFQGQSVNSRNKMSVFFVVVVHYCLASESMMIKICSPPQKQNKVSKETTIMHTPCAGVRALKVGYYLEAQSL